jgi:hypothetical protein
MRVWQFVTEQELQGWHSLRADDAGRDHLAELCSQRGCIEPVACGAENPLPGDPFDHRPARRQATVNLFATAAFLHRGAVGDVGGWNH